MRCWDIDPDIAIYCLEPFTFYKSFRVYEPVGKVASYKPGNESLITDRASISVLHFTFDLTQEPVQYNVAVREHRCLGLKKNFGDHQFLHCFLDLS